MVEKTCYVGISLKLETKDPRAIDVYGKGDIKDGYVVIGKGAGSIASGFGGGVAGVLLVGAPTGGAGLIVIDVAAVGLGTIGGNIGEKAGETLANKVNSAAFNNAHKRNV